MQLVTSSWFEPLRRDVVRIGISRGSPRNHRGYRMYRALAPGGWFRSLTDEEYVRRYSEEVLAALSPAAVLSDLKALANGAPTVALLCFEPPFVGPDFCHRALCSLWLWKTLKLEVPEYGQLGFGPSHPKLPMFMRTPGDAPGASLTFR